MKWIDKAPEKMRQQLVFLHEIDRLKSIIRATHNLHGGRKENTAEHSWFLAMMAQVLAEHSNEPVDVNRVTQMLLVHDLVEIDAGDHPLHGGTPPEDQAAKELAAADRIFGLLPGEQGQHLRAIWDEFEAGETADARFAKALDRFQPLMCNMANDGGSWPEYNVDRTQLENRVGKIARGSQALWEAAEVMFEDGQQAGWIKP